MRAIGLVAWLGLTFSAASASAGDIVGGLRTNQAYVEALQQNRGLKIQDPKAVFAAVLNALPDRVKVYPTEGYYYFSFHHAGVRYAGNMRLDAQARKRGLVYFTYFRSATMQHSDGRGQRALLGPDDGVEVSQVAPLIWQVGFARRKVVFELNDLSNVRPPAGHLGPNERFIGPVFDESGLRFFLSFDDKRNVFLFTLDETSDVAEQFSPSQASTRILIGRRTGFLFHIDKADRGRKALIGVFGGNIELNNYFDGPFDQLPDDFIDGESLRSAILKQRPQLAGKIDRFGNLEGGENRVLIAPYATYHSPDDIKQLSRCIARSGVPVDDACLGEPDAPPAK